MKDVWDMNKQEWRDYLKDKYKAKVYEKLDAKGVCPFEVKNLDLIFEIEADKRYAERRE